MADEGSWFCDHEPFAYEGRRDQDSKTGLEKHLPASFCPVIVVTAPPPPNEGIDVILDSEDTTAVRQTHRDRHLRSKLLCPWEKRRVPRAKPQTSG
jgi:hypothetical protein